MKKPTYPKKRANSYGDNWKAIYNIEYA